MDKYQLEIERNKIGSYFGKLRGAAGRKFQFVDNEEELIGLTKLELKVDKAIEDFEATEEEIKNKLYGNQFSTYYLGEGDDVVDMNGHDKLGVPLYLSVDLIIEKLKQNYIEDSRVSQENKNKANEIISKLEPLRENLASLKYSNIFDSKKHLAEDVKRSMKGSPSIDFKLKEKYGIRYVSLQIGVAYDDGYWKNGEYHSEKGGIYNTDSVLYKEDEELLENKEHEQRRKELAQEEQKYNDTIKKYFPDGILPMDRSIQKILGEKGVDGRIINDFIDLAIVKRMKGDAATPFYLLIDVKNILKDIDRLEEKIEWEKAKQEKAEKIAAEEKNNAIHAAKKRYQQKSLFWKFAHRKLSPKRLDLEQMLTEDIETLYYNETKGDGLKK